MSPKEKLKAFVVALLERNGDFAVLGERDSLVTSGRLQSIDVVEVVAFMEDEFALDLRGRGFDRDDFETLERMLALIGEEGPHAAAA